MHHVIIKHMCISFKLYSFSLIMLFFFVWNDFWTPLFLHSPLLVFVPLVYMSFNHSPPLASPCLDSNGIFLYKLTSKKKKKENQALLLPFIFYYNYVWFMTFLSFFSFFPSTHNMLNHWHYNNSIDDNGSLEYNFFHCYDKFNNYTFAVSRRRETTFISPYNRDDKSLIELKVGVLLPFHQNNNGWTRVMTMRYKKP